MDVQHQREIVSRSDNIYACAVRCQSGCQRLIVTAHEPAFTVRRSGNDHSLSQHLTAGLRQRQCGNFLKAQRRQQIDPLLGRQQRIIGAQIEIVEAPPAIGQTKSHIHPTLRFSAFDQE